MRMGSVEGRTLAALIWLAISGVGAASLSRADPPAGWTVQAPATTTLADKGPVVLQIPGELSSGQLASLAVELDQIDVTALAKISRGRIEYSPPQALAPGSHAVRVVEYAADGHLIPRGEWHFSVGGGPKTARRGWSVKGDVGATVSGRIADSDLTPPAPPAVTANGTFNVHAIRSFSEWTAEATVTGLYGTDNGTSSGSSVARTT